jgi:hypothetical protein
VLLTGEAQQHSVCRGWAILEPQRPSSADHFREMRRQVVGLS